MKSLLHKIICVFVIIVFTISCFCSSTYAATVKNVSNCGSDENKQASGGEAGDQTSEEYRVKPWYNFNIEYVLRYNNAEAAKKIAELAVSAANNDAIGYDQGERMTFWQELVKAKYKPGSITTKCEADCSASTIAICKAVGYLMNIKELQELDESGYTGSMKADFEAHGWKALSGSEYVDSPDKLEKGDVLLNEENHVNIYVEDAKRK